MEEIGPHVFMKLGNDVAHISGELNVLKNVFRDKAFDENSANTKALDVGSKILGIFDQTYGQV